MNGTTRKIKLIIPRRDGLNYRQELQLLIATPLKYFSFCQLRNLPGASVHYICSKKNEKEDYIQQIGGKECKESRSEVYFTGTANAVRHHASSLLQREQLLLA